MTIKLKLLSKQLFMVGLLSSTGNVIAGDQIFQYIGNQGVNSGNSIPFVIEPTIANNQLTIGQNIDVPMPDGRTISGVISTSLAGQNEFDKTLVVALENGNGSLQILSRDEAIVAFELFDNNNEAYFRSDIDSNGRGMMTLMDADTYQCMTYPQAPNDTVQIPLATEGENIGSPVSVLSEAELRTLQSRPGAPYVIYINYWGGTLSGTGWNDNFNSSNDIVYTPYSYDSDTTTFSNTDKYLMEMAWREAAEDYAPFNVNVTTDVNIFNATAHANKVQNIATTTNYFYTGAGGVAYVGVFGRSDDYYQTSWSWNSGLTSMGMTISHEVGHQMGLSHDGTSSLSYYSGHGDWGPIMGAPFGKRYVQFSKGEYPGANQTQDDLMIVRADISEVTDEAGNTLADAEELTLPVVSQQGVITPVGLTADIDVYKFTLGSQQTVTLSVKPSIIEAYDSEVYGTNLSMQAFLTDSNSTTIAQVSPTSDPTTNILEYTGQLDAGTYYIEIEALSPDLNWSSGFGEYGNGGFYQISVDGVGPTQTFLDVPPTHWAYDEIEELHAEGITLGCGGSNYCPDAQISRAQMAVFLLRSKYGSTYTPPAATGTMFGDISATYWAAPWVEQLANDGITSGCGNGNYCPTNPVRRSQMAIFMLRTKFGSSYSPPSATGIFDDVATSYWAAGWIEGFYEEGITGGCSTSPLLYCPSDPVSRAQMAVFIVRAFFEDTIVSGDGAIYPEGQHTASVPPSNSSE